MMVNSGKALVYLLGLGWMLPSAAWRSASMLLWGGRDREGDFLP